MRRLILALVFTISTIALAQVTPVGKAYTADQVWAQLLYKNSSGEVGLRIEPLNVTGMTPNQSPSLAYNESQVLSQVLYEDGTGRTLGMFISGIGGATLPPSTVGGSLLMGDGATGWQEQPLVTSKSGTASLAFEGAGTGVVTVKGGGFLGAGLSFEANSIFTSWSAYEFKDDMAGTQRLLLSLGGESTGNPLVSMFGPLVLVPPSVVPTTSGTNQGKLYFDSSKNKFQVSENAGPYVDMIGAGGTLPASTVAGSTLSGTGTGGWTENLLVTTLPGRPEIDYQSTTQPGVLKTDTGAGFAAGIAFRANDHFFGTFPAFQFEDSVTTSPRTFMTLGGDGNGNPLLSVFGPVHMFAPTNIVSVSGGSTGSIYFDSVLNKFKVSENGGAYVDMIGAGGTLPASTVIGSLLIADGAGGWIENTQIRSAAASSLLHFAATTTATVQVDTVTTTMPGLNFDATSLASTWPAFQFRDNAGTRQLAYIGGDSSTAAPLFGVNGVLEFPAAPATPAVSVAAVGRIYFDSVTNKFKVSENTGAYVDLVSTLPTSTVIGSLLIADGSGGWIENLAAGNTIHAQGEFKFDGKNPATGNAFFEITNPGSSGGIPTFQTTDKNGNRIVALYDKGRAEFFNYSVSSPAITLFPRDDDTQGSTFLIDATGYGAVSSMLLNDDDYGGVIQLSGSVEMSQGLSLLVQPGIESFRISDATANAGDGNTLVSYQTLIDDYRLDIRGLLNSRSWGLTNPAGIGIKAQDNVTSNVVGTPTAAASTPIVIFGHGSVAWTNPSNALASDNVYAGVTLSPSGTFVGGVDRYRSDGLDISGFGVVLPADAVVNGIKVSIEFNSTVPIQNVGSIRLLNPTGGQYPKGHRLYASEYSTSDQTITRGGVSWLWATPDIETTVQTANFGVRLFFSNSESVNVTISVDYIGLTIYYQSGGKEYALTTTGTNNSLDMTYDGSSLVFFDGPNNEIKNRVLTRSPTVAWQTQTVTFATSPYSAGTETTLFVDASGGAVTINLPTALSPNNDMRIDIKKMDATANTVTIQANGVETIDGSNTQVINSQYTAVTLVSDGTQWGIF